MAMRTFITDTSGHHHDTNRILFSVGPYGVVEVLQESAPFVVFRAIRKDLEMRLKERKEAFLIKAIRSTTTRQSMARLSHEFRVLKALEEDHVEGVIRPVELINTLEMGLVLVMRDWQQQRYTLRQLIDTTTYALHSSIECHQQETERSKRILDLKQFFMIAIGIVEVLKRLHERGFVHKDIKPDSVHLLSFIDNQEIKVQLFGLDICEKQQMHHCVREEKQAKDDDDDDDDEEEEEKSEGTWAYMSPEQTGRTNRLVDHRSDFYSLGKLTILLVMVMKS